MAKLYYDVNKMPELGVLKCSSIECDQKMGVGVKKNYSSANVAHLAIFNKENSLKSVKNNMNKTTYQSYIPNYNINNLNLHSSNRENSFNDFDNSSNNGFGTDMYGLNRNFNGNSSRNRQEFIGVNENVKLNQELEIKNEDNTNTNETENEHVCLIGKQLEEFRTKQCPLYSRGSCLNSSRCSMSHSETWPRRNPILFKYDYKLCPNIQFSRHENKMQLHGKCSFGRRCRFSHSKEEQLYHPDLYKTRYCLNFPNCKGYYCPFAHSKEELRTFNASNGSNFNNNNVNKINYNFSNNNNNNLSEKKIDNSSKLQDKNTSNKDLEKDLKEFKEAGITKIERDDFSNTASTYSSYNDNDLDEMSSTYNELSSPIKPFINNLKFNINENYVDINLNINNNETQTFEEVEEENWFESLIRTGLNLLDQDINYEQENTLEQDKWQEIFNNLSTCNSGKNCPFCSGKTVDFKFEASSDHMIKKSEEIFKSWG